MTDLLETPLAAEARRAAYDDVDALAEWSSWASFLQALPEAPRSPGVYLFREPDSGVVRYVGMAGERAGSGRPQGLYGRLSVHRTGNTAVSGFGEAALDLALADEAWVEARLERLRTRGPERSRHWARDAVARLAPEVRWSAQPDAADARLLEARAVQLLRPFGLWNR
ncbi:hypothetical protein [Solicola sp. PLA-1-18]|uniref:hypothetical protein n=1 Tax=Solicola sp. PLA-1-18 TaxID=3380532 RepID=UPI003B7AC64D